MAEFRWFGSSCFRIRGKDAAVLTDPIDAAGRPLTKQSADVVTLSQPPSGGDGIDLSTRFGSAAILRGPGEYEVRGLFVTGIRTSRDEATNPAAGRGQNHNTVYLIEIDGMTVCHLGHLGHLLTTEQTEALSGVDVLLVPTDGDVGAMDAKKAAEVVSQIQPKLVIPMQLRKGDGGEVAAFVKELGLEMPEAEEKLSLRGSDLGETVRVAVLRRAA